jgi:hypothetical protein
VQVRSIAQANMSWQPLHAVHRDLEADLGSPPGQFSFNSAAGDAARKPVDLHRAMINAFFCTGAMAEAHWFYLAQGQIRVCFSYSVCFRACLSRVLSTTARVLHCR